ncbi:MAG: argininosuccinate synthase, partial [Nitrosopumilaceae archaeon]
MTQKGILAFSGGLDTSVVVKYLQAEHNMDVIKNSDWIIDLGPEGGDEGGRIVATGTPEELAKAPGSYTGKYLKKLIKK